MSEEILKVLEKLKNKSNYQRDCNDGSYFIELFANEIYILCKFMEDLQQKVEQLEKEIDRLNNIINRIDSFVDRTIEVIKQQSTSDDEWILERLNGIKYLIELKDSDKE